MTKGKAMTEMEHLERDFQAAGAEICPLREALQRIRLYGSPFWNEAWSSPATIANVALNDADIAWARTTSRQPREDGS